MVTCSRMTVFAPMVSVLGSSLYLTSCGAVPRQANGNTLQPAPNCVRPVMTTCECTTTLSPSSTSGPITQNGPISTFGPSIALGSTAAVAWMFAMLAWLGLYDHGADLGFGDEVAVDLRLRAKAPDAAAIAHLLNVIADGVARHHGAPEARLVDCHEINERRLFKLLDVTHAERAGGLRHAFNEENARHHRIAREVPLEIGLVGGDVLDADGRAVTVHVDDAVDEKERIAMRQKLEDVGDLRRPQLRFHSALIHPVLLPWQSGLFARCAAPFVLIKLQILAFGKLA